MITARLPATLRRARIAKAPWTLQRRLIVPALEEPGPVQGYWDQQIGAGEDLAAGTVHPPSKRGS